MGNHNFVFRILAFGYLTGKAAQYLISKGHYRFWPLFFSPPVFYLVG